MGIYRDEMEVPNASIGNEINRTKTFHEVLRLNPSVIHIIGDTGTDFTLHLNHSSPCMQNIS